MHPRSLHTLLSWMRQWVRKKPELVKVLNNIGWLFVDKFFRMILGVLVGAWVARYLGPMQLGELAYIIALVGIFQAVSQLGLDNIAIRDISRNSQLATEILGSVFRLRMVSGLLCYACVIVAVLFLRPLDNDALVLAAIIAGGIIFQSADTIDLWFQSKLQSKRTVKAKAFAYFSTSLIKIVFILMHLPLVAFAIVTLFEMALSAGALAYSYKKYPTSGRWRWNAMLGRKLLSEGFPFLLSGVILTVYLQIDKILLKNLMGGMELGYYVAASALSSAFGFFPIILCASFAPKIAGITKDADRVQFFTKLNSILLWSGALLSVAIIVVADYLIYHLYGSGYKNSSIILKIQALSLMPIFLSVANDYLALSSGKGRVTLIRTIFGLFLNITFNYILIPRLGALGAAVSGLLAHVISNTFIYWIFMRDSFFMHMQAVAFPFFVLFKFIKPKLRTNT